MQRRAKKVWQDLQPEKNTPSRGDTAPLDLGGVVGISWRTLPSVFGRGWREPGNKTLTRGRIFRMVLIKTMPRDSPDWLFLASTHIEASFRDGLVTDPGMGPAWQKQSEARARRDSQSCSHYWEGPGSGLKWGKSHFRQLRKMWFTFHIYILSWNKIFKSTQPLNV